MRTCIPEVDERRGRLHDEEEAHKVHPRALVLSVCGVNINQYTEYEEKIVMHVSYTLSNRHHGHRYIHTMDSGKTSAPGGEKGPDQTAQ